MEEISVAFANMTAVQSTVLANWGSTELGLIYPCVRINVSDSLVQGLRRAYQDIIIINA